MKNKYDTCKHVERVGELAVFVHPSCPRLTMIRGAMVSSKLRCEECERWEERK